MVQVLNTKSRLVLIVTKIFNEARTLLAVYVSLIDNLFGSASAQNVANFLHVLSESSRLCGLKTA